MYMWIALEFVWVSFDGCRLGGQEPARDFSSKRGGASPPREDSARDDSTRVGQLPPILFEKLQYKVEIWSDLSLSDKPYFYMNEKLIQGP